MKKLTFLFALLCVSMMGWAIQYCDFPTGHLNDANFGDANGRILLTLVPTGNANEYQLSIKPNAAAGNVKKLDYLYAIIGDGGTTTPYPIEAGTDETSVEDELSATFTYTGGVNTMTIQWSYPEWAGRWQCTLENLDLSALDACSGGGDPTPDPDPVSYCDFPTGHEGNPNFGDANGRILLSLEPTGNANEYKMTIKPNYANGATKKLDYLYVIAGGNSPYPAEAGTDEGGSAYDELSVTFTNSNATTSFTIQWSNPDWGGRWQCALNDVPLTSLSACSGGGGSDPEPTEIYDVNFALQSQGGVASAKSGNDAGLANNGNTGDRWWSETADMTDAEKNDQWWQVDLGQRRIFNTIQIVWEGAWGKSFDIQISDDGDAWTTVKEIRNQNIPGPFPYEQTIDLDANKTARYVRFQGIERGTGYAYSFWEFRVLLPGVSVLTSITLDAAAAIAEVGGAGVALTAQPKDQNGQSMEAAVSWEITPAAAGHMSGNTFIPDQIGAASIRAYNGEVFSPAVTIAAYEGSNLALSTNISTDNKVIAQSASFNDAFYAVDTNEEGTWQGAPTDGTAGDDESRTYDSWFVLDLGGFYDINMVTIKFEGACSELYHVDFSMDNSTWNLGYNFVGSAGVNGHTDYLTALDNNIKVRYFRFWSTKAATQYGMKIFDVKVFGIAWVPSGDTEAPVMNSASLVSSTSTSAIIAVDATDADGEVARYHVVDATNGIDANYVPEAGNITITGLTHATSYNFTITAIDLANHESENSIAVPVSTPFDVTINLALNKTCEAGYEDGNPAETAAKVNDGNEGTSWVTYANRPASEEWWVVDLGEVYALSNITTVWAGDYSTKYILQARVAAPSAADKANDAAWVTLATVTGAEANGTKSTDLSGIGRYVRFRSIERSGECIRLKELRVFGTGKVAADTEKPVMGAASLVSKTDSHAIISVAATDNTGIASFHVVDNANGIDGHFVAEAGQITVTGLSGGTTYNFVITAIDFFGNESANSKSVAVTTTAHYTQPQAACPAPTWPTAQVKAMYSPTYSANCNLGEWGSGTTVQDTEFGKKYTVGPIGDAGGYFGMVDFALNCLMMEKLHFDIWVADDMTIRFVPIWGGAEQGITKNLVGQEWNSIDIDLTEYTAVTDWGNIVQFKLDQMLHNFNLWVANAYFYRTSAIVDNEAPTNVSASVTAQGFYSVKITAQAEDNSGAVNFKVMNGTTVMATGAAATATATEITIENLASGTNYNFNVVAYDDSDNEAELVAVVAETKFMPAAAPAPDFSNKRVLPVFTDAMAGGPAVIHSGGWGERTIAEWVNLSANDKVFYVQNFDYAGWHSWGSDLDATGMQFLHVDVYSLGATSVNVTPISHDPTKEGSSTIALTPNAWTGYDVPLSDYANIEWDKIFQFKFMGAVGGDELMIDNVYFWSYQVKTNAQVGSDETTGGWATFASAVKLAVPTGLKAYKAAYEKTATEEILNLEEISVIPANAGVVLRGAENTTYALELTDADEPDMSDNVLVGCVTRTDISALHASNDIFCMRYSEMYEMTGFFLYTGQYVPAGKAYLKLPKASGPSGAPRKVRFVINDHQVTTGVDSVEKDAAEVTKFVENGQLYIRRGEAIYTIQGARVR